MEKESQDEKKEELEKEGLEEALEEISEEDLKPEEITEQNFNEFVQTSKIQSSPIEQKPIIKEPLEQEVSSAPINKEEPEKKEYSPAYQEKEYEPSQARQVDETVRIMDVSASMSQPSIRINLEEQQNFNFTPNIPELERGRNLEKDYVINVETKMKKEENLLEAPRKEYD